MDPSLPSNAVKTWAVFMVIAFMANIGVCYLAAYGIAKPAVNFLLRNNPQGVTYGDR
jgi:hypothetical protein